ncbi:MAG: hypothetical protein AAFR38_00095 [Planctomycetota bacterium]
MKTRGPIAGVIGAVVASTCLGGLLGGCTRYHVPGGPADFRAMGLSVMEQEHITDSSIAEEFEKRPAATFPARIAVVRLQDRGYRNHRHESWGDGSATVVSVRDVEDTAHFDRLVEMDGIAGIAMLNRMIIPESIHELDDLRTAAARVQADMVYVYTFNTRFGVTKTVPFLGAITLGLFPNDQARVSSTASAVLMDSRTGYIYGLAEGTSKTTQLANNWTSQDAIDQSRIRAEREAFDQMIEQTELMWRGMFDALRRQATPDPTDNEG